MLLDSSADCQVQFLSKTKIALTDQKSDINTWSVNFKTLHLILHLQFHAKTTSNESIRESKN